jgi:short-subunit dehydrogenase
LAFAKLLAQDGHDLILVARRADKLQQLAEELQATCRVTVTVIPTDLGQTGGVASVVATLAAKNIDVDVLVNNAGSGTNGSFSETPWEKSLNLLAVNVVAPTELAARLLPGMIARKRGQILNLASTAAFLPGPHMATYYASKAYLLNWSEAIAYELRGTGVMVTALCPGPTQSEFFTAAQMTDAALAKTRNLPTAEAVAAEGLAAMRAGKPMIIQGFMNRLLNFSLRFVPRSVTTAIAANLNKAGGH